MKVYIVCVKNLGKHSLFLPNKEFHRYLVRWPFSWSTCEMTGWQDSSNSNYVLHTWPFREFLYSWASRETTLIIIAFLILHQSLTLIPYNIDWITTKLGMELQPTTASWKSQLYISIGIICYVQNICFLFYL